MCHSTVSLPDTSQHSVSSVNTDLAVREGDVPQHSVSSVIILQTPGCWGRGCVTAQCLFRNNTTDTWLSGKGMCHSTVSLP
ncbi:hypothetical protein RRG08_011899 [Elysia crispata]|uniref:Uncharacterized protein n=1 Tax=Elysia crispata TaxID=231223 RepID=A0AAE0ZNE7_9GAST|nr:hypothetical protein RRG08_011899 [Elysia crispata]